MKSLSNKVCAIILCAGKGERTGLFYNKIFYMFGKKTVLEMTLDNFSKSSVTNIILVIADGDEQKVHDIVDGKYNVDICYGGTTRAQSVLNGLKKADGNIVVIHDGARPYASPALIDKCIESAITNGSGIAAIKSVDSLKSVKNGYIEKSINREITYRAQTPQAFKLEQIRLAYQHAADGATDDSDVYLRAGFLPKIVDGDPSNIKITNENDLYNIAGSSIKIGVGFDAHRITDGQLLVLGGVVVPWDKGLLGHSDADVLIHAVMDALLSAAGLPDIGVHFPDSDEKYKGISSVTLLTNVKKILDQINASIQSISCVIMAQKPKLAEHIPQMRKKLSETLEIAVSAINISATTTETLGIIGEEKGMAASAVCFLSV